MRILPLVLLFGCVDGTDTAELPIEVRCQESHDGHNPDIWDVSWDGDATAYTVAVVGADGSGSSGDGYLFGPKCSSEGTTVRVLGYGQDGAIVEDSGPIAVGPFFITTP